MKSSPKDVKNTAENRLARLPPRKIQMKILRAAFRMTSFLAMTFGLYLTWFVLSPFIPNKLLWRQMIFGAWGRGFVKIARISTEVRGAPPQPPFFLVSNHLTYSDIPVLCSIAKGVFVAKGEIEGWFLAGRICRDMGAIFINRQNRRDIPRAGSLILDALERGEGVVVFPEGTSTKGEDVLKFNSSFLEFAAQRDLPVHFAAINYRTPPGEMTARAAVAWWEDISFFWHMWRMFKVSRIEAVITFGEEPVHSTDRKELSRTLWQKVREKFVPLV